MVAVQRNTKTLTFNPFIAAMSKRLFDVDKKTMDIIKTNMDGEQGKWGLIPETHDGIYTALAPGPTLDWMNETMLRKLLPFVDELEQRGDTTEIDLYSWIRRAFAVSSTEAVYGPKNPFNHIAGLEEAFW